MAYVLVITLLAAALEYRSLIMRKLTREAVISSLLLCIGIVLGVLQLLGVNIPSPLTVLKLMLTPLHQAIQNWFI